MPLKVLLLLFLLLLLLLVLVLVLLQPLCPDALPLAVVTSGILLELKTWGN